MSKPNDPLLLTTTWVLRLALGLLIFASVAMLIATPALLAFAPYVTAQIAIDRPDVVISDVRQMAVLTLAVLSVTTLAALWVRHLLAIVHTVTAGDPLTDANAARLRTMAWLSLAIQIATVALTLVARTLAEVMGDKPADFSLSLNGLLLVLLLFVLARVFSVGAAMRRDLEGTI